jgi:long-chain acyl-CoA synthetase
MIRHRNYHAMVTCLDELETVVLPGDVLLLYLPLAHNYGRLLSLAAPHRGFSIAFCPDPYQVAQALPEIRPTFFPSVPRIYEKIHAAVVAGFDEQRGVKSALVRWALHVGRRASRLRREQRELPPLLALQHRLADRLVYSKVKERLGGRLRYANSGGAPLAPEIAEFFHALDILILEGYGLSECTCAATGNQPGRFKFGTVGPPLPHVEVRIADDGEILLRSPTIFAGYYKHEEATRQVLTDDGWLLTGDVGELDEDGFLRITDRKKDIIVTAGGKNVAPQNLENELKASKYVSQALVVGDRRPYVAALITLDAEEAARLVDVRAAIEELVEEVNARHSRYEQIKRFAILPRDFSIEEGELTPTLKLRRRVCQEHFAGEIEALYAERQ